MPSKYWLRHLAQAPGVNAALDSLYVHFVLFQACEFMYIVIWYKRTVAAFGDISLRLLYQVSEYKLHKFVDLFNVW